MKCFIYLFPSWLLFTGQLSCLAILPMSLSLSSCRMVQSNRRWSTVWLPPPQGQSGDYIVLKRCSYDLVLPWDVTNAVKFGVNVILVFNLSFMFGKNSFVVSAFVVLSHDMIWYMMRYDMIWYNIIYNIILYYISNIRRQHPLHISDLSDIHNVSCRLITCSSWWKKVATEEMCNLIDSFMPLIRNKCSLFSHTAVSCKAS